MTRPAATVAARLSALRLVSFIPPERDAVHVGLLTPDAEQVVDLAGLGISDALEALDQLPMLRQAAGAILRGPARSAFPVGGVHLVAPIPLVRSVVQGGVGGALHFADPVTLHGPGGHLARADASAVQVGLAAVVGASVKAATDIDDDDLTEALVGTVVVLGWPIGSPVGMILQPGAIGPFIAVPQRQPESLMLAVVAPLAVQSVPDDRVSVAAPTPAAFRDLARAALRSHVLRPGDLLAIFPEQVRPEERRPVSAGSWVRASAPGLGTLSLAVR